MSRTEFLDNPLELNYIMHSQIGKFLAREKIANAWANSVAQVGVKDDEWNELVKVAYPQREQPAQETISRDELKARAKARKNKSKE